MLCRYPDNGFGSKNGSYYLLDAFGNRYDIKTEYNEYTGEFEEVVTLNDSIGGTYSEKTLTELIKRIELETDSRIRKW